MKDKLKEKLAQHFYNEGVSAYFSITKDRLVNAASNFKLAANYGMSKANFDLAITLLNQLMGKEKKKILDVKKLFLDAGVNENYLEILWEIDVWKAFKGSTLKRFHLCPPDIYFKASGMIGSTLTPITRLFGAVGPSEDKDTRFKISTALFHMLEFMSNLESLFLKNYITDGEIPVIKQFLKNHPQIREIDFLPSYLDLSYDKEGFLKWIRENLSNDIKCNI